MKNPRVRNSTHYCGKFDVDTLLQWESELKKIKKAGTKELQHRTPRPAARAERKFPNAPI